jgi:aminoglycoside phosphotransferase (APT) family kinase protein
MAEDSESLNDPTRVIVEWLESELGPVLEISRQPRWRPMWFATVERAGEEVPVCVRGDRADTELTWPLDHEMRFHEVLTAHDIKAPRVFGWIDEVGAFAMDAMPGRPDFVGVPRADSDRIVAEYVEELAKVHQLDIAPFVAADITRADTQAEASTIGMARMKGIYRDQKQRPNPFLEWVLGWLSRHPIEPNDREAPIVWDSGQFHHDGEHFVSLIDLELGHIGDPMMDLAGWRMRDSVIPFGDFDEIYQRYAQLVGAPVDIDAIQHHHIAFTISNDMAFSHRLKDPIEITDYTTYLQWCAETNIYATEAIAEFLGADLPGADLPQPGSSRFDAPHQHLVRSLRSISSDDDYVKYQIRNTFRLSRHLARANEIGDAVVAADLDDAINVLGERPSNWEEGEAELERFVLADTDGRHDDDLLWLFHRRNLRAQMLNGPAGSAMTRHNPIQPFKPR